VGPPEKFDALLDDGEEDSVGVWAVLVEVREGIGLRRLGRITISGNAITE
jgi:hypothetical protein